ncbi:enhanced intracellular survival protein Eis [Paenibacillus sp. sgz500958]|uniref:GNAT family N-acetyltransferase n=1 Tax=Paenibacillus sp. sgz500958 TaxID=3242475 RepID=UPI0036D3E332
MEIRRLKVTEFEESMTLSEYAFQYRVSGADREQALSRFKPERVWGVFDEGELAAKLTLLPLRVYIQGNSVSMGGIAGVATWPENRRQGHVTKLLSHALQTMNESGQLLSFLHPFSIPFYRKYGWEIYCEYKKYTIPVAKLPLKKEVSGTVKRNVNDIEILNSLYAEFAAQYNGTLERTREWWERSVLDEEGLHAVYYSITGEPEGYALYRIDKKELVIDEFVFRNEQARQGLWSFFCNHDSMVTGVALKMVPSDDILPYLLPDPRIPQENYPYFMARIVNVKAFVEAFIFVRGVSGKINLEIKDDHAPWNSGLWECTINEEGRASLIQMQPSQITADINCDIGSLTVLLMGYKRPEELYRYGKLSGTPSAAEWLERAVPRANTALLDFF